MNNVNVMREVNTERWTSVDDSSAFHKVKAVATITTLALGVLASAYLAYKNPSRWFLTTFTVIVVNLYALPKVLHHGNATLIKLVLVVNLTALGSLSIGGIGVASVSLGQAIWTATKTYQFSTVVFHACWLTGLLGYGLPLAQEALKKVYHLIHDREWHQRLSNLHEHFNARPEIGLGLLQTNLWKNLILQLVILKPDYVLSFCHLFRCQLPDYIWPIVTATSARISLDQFQNLLGKIEQTVHLATLQLQAQLEGLEDENIPEAMRVAILPQAMKRTYRMSIKTSLRSLAKEDLPQAISSLLMSGSKLIPSVFSNSEFLEFFTEDALDATNYAIEQFLDLTNGWEDLSVRYLNLDQNMRQLQQELDQDIQQFSFEQKEEFSERYMQINQEFNELRSQIEKVYFNKRIWQSFAPLWEQEMELPFEQGAGLLVVLHDQPLLDGIDLTYRSMVEAKSGNNGQTVSDRRQHLTNKMLTLNKKEEDEEEISAVIYLAANKDFKQKDYEDLQEWLNLDSPHQIAEVMDKMGLSNEEDLYEKNILSHERELDKAEIRQNLRHYIEQAPKSQKLADRVQAADAMDRRTAIYTLTQKVLHVVYYAIHSGLILVPILIQPHAGGTGFVVGTVFFILKRFGAPGTQFVTDNAHDFIEALPLGTTIYHLLNRRIFDMSPQRRAAAQQFANADFSQRMRIVNWQILQALFMSFIGPRSNEEPFLGGFLQGVALANEVVNLV